MHLKQYHIIFDFWGTLATLVPGPDFGEMIAQLAGITKEQYLAMVQRYWFARNLTPEQFADILIADQSHVNCRRNEIVDWIRHPIQRAQLYPDVIPCLQQLQHCHSLYLVSDNSSNGREILNRLSICSFFSHVYLSCEVGLTKASGLYEHVFQCIPAHNAIVIGDSLIADIERAAAYGAKTIHLDRSSRLSTNKVLSSLEAL